MKNRIFYLIVFVMFVAHASVMRAEQRDTVNVAEFGIIPNTYENQSARMRQAIDAYKACGAKVLKFSEGRYDFWPEGAMRKELYVSNTSTEQECPDKTKVIGIWAENVNGLTIDGGGATLVFHGKITMLSLYKCRDITLSNVHFDFERPGGSEITYSRVDDTGVVVKMHRDTRYEIINGKINLYGEGWRSNRNHCIKYINDRDRFTYSGDWNMLASSEANELEPGVVHFAIPADFRPQVGDVLTVRDIIRDQVGMFLCQSENIKF